MMIYAIKYKMQLNIYIYILMLGACFNVAASECGIFQYQKNRSSGVSISSNKCDDNTTIAKGTVFDLSAKGRLWLKSTVSNKVASEFQMICQNRTDSPIRLEFSGMLLPWLNQAKLKDCRGWVDNKLSCAGGKNKKYGVFCVLSFFKSYDGYNLKYIERTTSVKMREVIKQEKLKSTLVSVDKQKIVETIIPELQMCKKINKKNHPSRISWKVNQVEELRSINITSAEGIGYYGLFQCVQTVISTFPYPGFSKQADFSVEF